MNLTIILIALLVAISAGALAYAFLFPQIEVEKRTAGRFKRVQAAESDLIKFRAAKDRVQELSRRRKSMQDSLKDHEKKLTERNQRRSNRSIKGQLEQADLNITPARFHLFGVGGAILLALISLLYGANLLLAAGLLLIAALGAPRWLLSFLIKRRQEKFLEELPTALDVMCRSIRSGLPLNDAIRLIASDGQEPVKKEFRRIVDAQQMGLGVADAVERMSLTMPLQEVSFLATVIAIQAQAGGNLSEALSNLSRVLRDRRKMRAKVKALSMEAKASAVIIGALPFIVAGLVYVTSPGYITILFTDPRGHLILLASGIWMAIGIFIMRNMINFDI
jgi:tight adherence protein B